MAKLDRKIPVKVLKSKEKNWDTRPNISFDDTELPAIKSWQVGEEYQITVNAKMTSISIREKKGKQTTYADFVVTGIYNK